MPKSVVVAVRHSVLYPQSFRFSFRTDFKSETQLKFKIMFSKHTKFISNCDTVDHSVTVYRFLWIPIYKVIRERVYKT